MSTSTVTATKYPKPISSLPKHLIGVSTKLYFTTPQSTSYLESVLPLLPRLQPSTSLFFIPSFLAIPACTTILSGSDTAAQLPSRTSLPSLLLGAQDCFWEASGAYTGEVSPTELAAYNVRIVELGHAERRSLFCETDVHVAAKAKAAVSAGLLPLVCIGERTKSSSGIASEAVGRALSEVRPQVESVLAAIPHDAAVVFAYEPVWAIGASEPAGKDHVVAVVVEVKRIAREGGRKGDVRVLYGGSAGPGTYEGIREGADGLFLGRFAHDIGNLAAVVEEVCGG